MLREFGLQELVLRTGKEVCPGAGDGGDEVMDCNGLAVESALLVGVGGKLNGLDGAGLLGNDGPEVAVVMGDGEGQQGVVCAGVEVGEEDGDGVPGQSRRGAAAVGGDVEQDLRGAWRGDDVDGRAIDGGGQEDVFELVGRGELFGFGDVVVEALHGDADDGGGVVTTGVGGEGDSGRADGLAVLGDDEAAGLGAGGGEPGQEALPAGKMPGCA